MRITVIGAGNAGRDLAATLCKMGQDLVVIDTDADALEVLASNHDIMTIEGSGTDPDVLMGSGIERTDLLAAVTPHDEINLLACCWAKTAGVAHTIARLSDHKHIRSPLVDTGRLGVDLPLVHKQECAKEVFDVLFRPGALEITSMLDDKIAALGLKLPENTRLCGKPFREFRSNKLFGKLRFIGIVKKGRLSIPDGNTVAAPGDDVYVVLPAKEIEPFLDWVMAKERRDLNKVVIAGGGGLGLSLALLLEDASLETVLIENHRGRAQHASEELINCLVLNADAAEASVLREAGIDSSTAFAAITGDEEMNIVCCALAKQMGAQFSVARIDKPEYVPIIGHLNLVDRVVCPNISLIRAIVRYIRGEAVEEIGLFHRIEGEIQEVAVQPGSKQTGTAIRDLKLPRDSIVAAIRRGDDAFVPTGECVLKDGDRLAIYCLPKSAARVNSAF